jgi:mono/diheme cytochrome c family protein
VPHGTISRHHTLTLLTLILGPVTAQTAEPARPAVNPALWSFLDAHCVGCHDSATKKGGLDLEALSADLNNPNAFAKWVQVHDRIRAGEMPPKTRTNRPAPPETETVLKILAADLANAEQAHRAAEGRAVFRRLNRTEYEYTLRDLFGIPGLRVKDRLPEDGRAFGFDKSAAGLELSYVQLAKYMEAADVALDAAIAPHAARPAQFKVHIPGTGCPTLFAHAFLGQTVFLKNFKYDDSIIPIPTGRITKDAAANKLKRDNLKSPYAGTMGVLVPEGVGEFKPRFPFRVVEAGRYKLRMSVWSFLWDKGQVKPSPRTEAAALVAEGRTLGYFDAPSLKPTVTEIEVWLNRMTSPRDELLFNAASLWPAGPLNGNVANYTGPGIALDWLEIEGPLLDQWPTAAHRRLFGELPLVPLPPAPRQKGGAKGLAPEPAGGDFHKPKRPPDNAYLILGHGKPFIKDLQSLPQHFVPSTVASQAPEADARRLLADFLPRAFRRPVSPEEAGRYVELFKTRLAEGDMFEVALRTAYQAALCAPDFLFLTEKPGELDQWAMASRLSYFLWSSMPDDELLALAERGKLHDRAVLHAQVERMLKDPKAERFIVDFTDQWLDLKDIDETTPDKKLYPEFRSILRDSMLAEPRAFFRELLEKDLSATNVSHSDFAMLNQRLADHYRIPGVVGSAMRRVPLPTGSGRGGFLTQAAVLKVTANGTVTSPVKRGAWVLCKIIGRPPDPPPGDVPAIEPDVRGTTTIREMLARHRTNPSCAACHAKIDPPGFALESFDVLGSRQTRYRSLNDQGDVVDKSQTYSGRRVAYTWGPKVDPAGVLADGRAFKDVEEFKKLLLEDPRAVARNLVGQLVTDATGAPVGFADRAAVEKVLDRTADSRYGLRSLIHAIVESTLFQRK